jgi:hypothetical protein
MCFSYKLGANGQLGGKKRILKAKHEKRLDRKQSNGICSNWNGL